MLDPLCFTSEVGREACVGIADDSRRRFKRRRVGCGDVPAEVPVENFTLFVIAVEELDLRASDKRALRDKPVELFLLAVQNRIAERGRHGLVDSRSPFFLEAVRDVEQHNHVDVEDLAGFVASAEGIGCRVISPRSPVAFPVDRRRDAVSGQFVGVLLVEAGEIYAVAEVKPRNRERLVAVGLKGDVPVFQIAAQFFDERQRGEMINVAAVLRLRPEYFGIARVVAVVVFPFLCRRDGFRRRDRKIGINERRPVSVDILRCGDQRGVNGFLVAPAGRREIGRDDVAGLVKQFKRRNTRDLAVGRFPADYGRFRDFVVIDRVIRKCRRFNSLLADVGNGKNTGAEVEAQRVVGAENFVLDRDRRENDVERGKRCFAVRESERFRRCRGAFVLVGIEDVDNVDRADISVCVRKVSRHRFAERVFRPLRRIGEVSDLFHGVAQVADFDRHVYLAGIIGEKIHGRGADIHRRGARLRSVLRNIVADLAVNAILVVVHVISSL